LTTATTTTRDPALELLARYAAVLRAAWAARAELAGPRRLAEEAAFLPAALSLQETPVHPAPRRAMWVIMAIFVATLTWSVVGQVDIVAVASGRIVVSQRSKLIQPLDTAVVRAIHVKDGDRVREGQLLVELDATASSADNASIGEQQLSARSEMARSQALLRALQSGTAPALDRPREAQAPDTAALLRSEWSSATERFGTRQRLPHAP
jgi:hemolysin D